MGKIAIYTRVSSLKQLDKDGDSLEVQKQKCENLLINSFNISKENFIYFEDAGISAKDTTARKGVTDLLNLINNQSDPEDDNYIKGICCFTLSRLSRNMKDTTAIFEKLKNKGIELYTVDLLFRGDLNDPNNFIMAGVMGLVNELYLMNLSGNVKPGMCEAASRGFQQGGMPPLGYDLMNKDIGDGVLRNVYVINESEREVVNRIFSMYVEQQYSLYKIAVTLNKEGFKTKSYGKKGGNKFTTLAISNILKNAVYIGKIVWGKNIKDGKNKKREQIELTKEDILKCTGVHEEIVNQEMFFKAFDRLIERSKDNKNLTMTKTRKKIDEKVYYAKNRRIFSNVLKCPSCGARMTPSINHGNDKRPDYFYYICSNKNSGKGCNGYYRVKEELVLDLIRKDFIDSYGRQYQMLRIYLDKHLKDANSKKFYTENENSNLNYRLTNLINNKNKLDKKLDNTIDSLIEAESDRVKKRLNENIKEIEKEICNIDKEIKSIEYEIESERKQKAILLENLKETKIGDFEEYFNSLTLEKQRLLIEQRYDEIIIETESIRKGSQKTYKLKEMKYNEKFSIRHMCKVLDVDFEDFYKSCDKETKKKMLHSKYFKDAIDYSKQLVEYYNGQCLEDSNIYRYMQELKALI
ncbi:recombinase family protein [Clostridium sporogenes]|uniref:recombinase family protein n=1 Tax=Clostridium sporogenes TaxID=1509 RepID=UPI0022384915|nr:recombinase family protein [Clostridium sporogenes]MCW6078104.1 recombinase family protein [Clostridium sporogenes]